MDRDRRYEMCVAITIHFALIHLPVHLIESEQLHWEPILRGRIGRHIRDDDFLLQLLPPLPIFTATFVFT